jgi:predicted Fe-Mo cluster-binding NifX family protein
MKFADRPVSFTLIAVLVFTAIVFQRPGRVAAQQTDDPHRAELYNCWYANRERNPAAAADCGRRFLEQYGSAHDRYAAAVEKFMWEFENPERVKFEGFSRLLGTANETDQPVVLTRLLGIGFGLLKKEPNDLSLQIRLGQAGYQALKRKIETYTADAIASAESAVKQIDAGQTPDASFAGYPAEYAPRTAWTPFASKDDALAHLEYAIGYLSQTTKPDRAAPAFFRATQFGTELKSDPVVYALLGIAYDVSAWEQASRRYRSLDQGATAEREAALNALYQITDRLLSYYAHAIVLAGSDPARQQVRETASGRLEVLYRFRHENSTNGLPEFVRTVAQSPVVDPQAPFEAAKTGP